MLRTLHSHRHICAAIKICPRWYSTLLCTLIYHYSYDHRFREYLSILVVFVWYCIERMVVLYDLRCQDDIGVLLHFVKYVRQLIPDGIETCARVECRTRERVECRTCERVECRTRERVECTSQQKIAYCTVSTSVSQTGGCYL